MSLCINAKRIDLQSHDFQKVLVISEVFCNGFINFRHHHDRALLVPDLLMTLPVKPPYLVNVQLNHEVCLHAQSQELFKESARKICLNNRWELDQTFCKDLQTWSTTMSLFPRFRMLLPAMHRIRYVICELSLFSLRALLRKTSARKLLSTASTCFSLPLQDSNQ